MLLTLKHSRSHMGKGLSLKEPISYINNVTFLIPLPWPKSSYLALGHELPWPSDTGQALAHTWSYNYAVLSILSIDTKYSSKPWVQATVGIGISLTHMYIETVLLSSELLKYESFVEILKCLTFSFHLSWFAERRQCVLWCVWDECWVELKTLTNTLCIKRLSILKEQKWLFQHICSGIQQFCTAWT